MYNFDPIKLLAQKTLPLMHDPIWFDSFKKFPHKKGYHIVKRVTLSIKINL